MVLICLYCYPYPPLESVPLPPFPKFLCLSSSISVKDMCLGFSPAVNSTSALPKRIRSLFLARDCMGGVVALERSEAEVGVLLPDITGLPLD